MKLLFSSVLVLCTVALFAKGAEKNLYPNASLENKTFKNGKVYLYSHWYSENIAPAGKFKENNAIKLIPKKYTWGCSAVISTGELKLAAGKYRLSIWVKYDKKDAQNIKRFHFIRRYPVNGKTQNSTYNITGKNIPAADKWSEISWEFEVKAGTEKCSLLCGHFGPAVVSALYSSPRLIKL